MPGIYNRLVRWRGRGHYSHVEIEFSDGWSASSSFEDGGTRFKKIDYSKANWDSIILPPEWEDYARLWFKLAVQANEGYDIWGNLHIAIGFLPDSFQRHFCSEAIAKSLQLTDAFRFEPNALYSVIHRMVGVHDEAMQQSSLIKEINP